MITKIQKRDGRQMPFNVQKIADAIYKAATAVGGKDYNSAIALAEEVCRILDAKITDSGKVPTVEEVQDTVEKESGDFRPRKFPHAQCGRRYCRESGFCRSGLQLRNQINDKYKLLNYLL